MKLVHGELHPEEQDMRNKAMQKISQKSSLKDMRDKDKYTYFFEKYYPHFVLMRNEFGFAKCFKYSEIACCFS